MAYKKYTIDLSEEGNEKWEGAMEDLEQGYPKNSVKLDITDLARFFRSSRGFPTILSIGPVSGEGQSGGRYVSDIARELEKRIVADIGVDEYRKRMRELVNK